jgi:hypothetical protein
MKDKNLVYVIKDDPSYYNKDLPATAPQYISVLLRSPSKGIPGKFFYEAFNRKILLDELSVLPGKK